MSGESVGATNEIREWLNDVTAKGPYQLWPKHAYKLLELLDDSESRARAAERTLIEQNEDVGKLHEERDRLRARVATLEAGLDEFIRTEETSGVENERDLWFFYRELKKRHATSPTP